MRIGLVMSVLVRDLCIGEGLPKVIVPVMGADAAAVVPQAREAVAAGADCIEWRVDYCGDIAAALRSAAAVREAAGEAPLLFTIRTQEQGGEASLEASEYEQLVGAAIDCGFFDLVDIELCWGDALVRGLVDRARAAGVASVVSDHIFASTPETAQLVQTLMRMHDLGADIPKLAVMANSDDDAVRLMDATSEVVHGRGVSPVIAMAMSEHGAVTRTAGEAFGSAMTFAAVGAASAPGQLSIRETREAITALHEGLKA